jgi:hypothetical protein
MLLVGITLIKKMDRRQKCKKCRKGVLEFEYSFNYLTSSSEENYSGE